MFSNEEQEFAWAVGLFEGEGAAGVFGNGKNKHGVAQLKMRSRDRDVVDRFHRAIGVGRVREENYASMKGPMYGWVLTRQKELLDLCLRIYPYLSERRKTQIAQVIEFCKERLSRPSRARTRWDNHFSREKEGV